MRERRAKAAGRLTEKERAAIGRLASRQARRMGVDRNEIYPDMIAWAREQGMSAVDALKAETSRLNKRKTFVKVRIGKDGTARFVGDTRGQAANLDAMDAFAARWSLPDSRWLYYH